MDWSESLLSFLAGVTVRSLCLAALAGTAVLVFRVKSAAARHAVWTVAMMSMLLLATLSPLLPSIPLRVLRAAPAESLPVIGIAPPVAAAQPVSPPAAVPAPATAAISWHQAAAGFYLLGLAAFLMRLIFGYLFTQRLVNASRSVNKLWAVGISESAWLSVPITVGWLRPRVLLPADWESWDGAKLQAVLAHEQAHIARADWLISILTGLNRCLFWFHPLAWWLERKLASLAEEACDDAVLLEVNSENYAQALLDMAAAVKTTQGRLIWEAMAMAKAAEVRKRIERVLDETRQIPRALTRARWAALAACSLPLIYVAAVVRLAAQEVPKTPAAMTEFLKGKRQLTQADVATMEQYLTANPHDLDARNQLIVHYFASGVREPRIAHILWLIANHPESNQATFASLGISPLTGTFNDVADYLRAGGLWRQHIAAKPNDLRILANAAQFFSQPGGDFEEAERLLLRGREIEPSNTAWAERLGRLYAAAVLGATGDSRFVNSNAKMADRVKTELENSNDGRLVYWTGVALTGVARRPMSGQPPIPPGILNLDDHPLLVPAVDFGQRLITRARDLGAVGSVTPLPPEPRTLTPQEAEARMRESEAKFNALTPAPAPVNRVSPTYPPLARQARIQSEIRLKVRIDANGALSQTEVHSGHPLLVPAAMEAVRQWKWASGSAGEFGLRLSFRLDGTGDAVVSSEPVPAGVVGSVKGGIPNGVPGGVVGGIPGGRSGFPQRIRVGAPVQAARLTNKVEPEYPALARQAGLEGNVTLQVLINKEGRVESVEPVSGHPLLVAAAKEAVMQWVYQKTLLNDEPVEVTTQVIVPFELNR